LANVEEVFGSVHSRRFCLIVSEMICAGHGEMQSDEDRVLQFAGQNSDKCSVLQLLQQYFECFCWFQAGLIVNKSVRRPFQRFQQPHILRKFEKNEQVA